MAEAQAQRVLEVLAAEGPAMPIVVLARRLGLPPSRVIPVLDDLYDEGAVMPGRERGTVSLVPEVPGEDGRFRSSAPAARAPR